MPNHISEQRQNRLGAVHISTGGLNTTYVAAKRSTLVYWRVHVHMNRLRQLFLLLLSLATFFIPAESSASQRVVVTLEEYKACEAGSAVFESNTTCASVAKCYGRRLVLALEECEEAHHFSGQDVDSIRSWVQGQLGSAWHVADVEWDIVFSIALNANHSVVEDAVVVVDMNTSSVMDNLDNANSSLSIDQWNLRAINIYELWEKHKTRGKNHTIAVLDSGVAVSALDAFENRIVPGYDFVSDESLSKDGDGRDSDYYDPGDADAELCAANSWHGTKVASVLAADYHGFLGVAPEATVMPVRVLGRCGTGYASDVADGIVWAAGGHINGLEDSIDSVQIVLMALSGKGRCPSFMQTAVDLAVAKGVGLFAAAGNDPSLTAADHFPANCRGVISVGALNARGEIASYSLRGADVYMPGGDLDKGVPCLGGDLGEVESCVGTSIAVPHAGGMGVVTREVAGNALEPSGIDAGGKNMYFPFVHSTAVTDMYLTCGFTHSCVLLEDKTIKCWGCGAGGQLGYTATSPVQQNTPVSVLEISTAVQVDAWFDHTCALLQDKTVKCWGSGSVGQLGYTATSPVVQKTPVAVVGITNAVQISTGVFHTCAVLQDNTIKCWGSGNSGQLGYTATSPVQQNTPVSVLEIRTAVQVECGYQHTCAILQDKTIKCWGFGTFGQLGYIATNPVTQNTPVSVLGINNAVQLALGEYYTCALLQDNTVKCWGDGRNGQLGYSASGTSSQYTPIAVFGITNAVQIASGGNHMCALLQDSTIKCWGQGNSGQLGYTETSPTRQLTPVAVVGITDAVKVAGGYYHTCAILKDKSVKCWGDGSCGQLGNNATAQQNTPVKAMLVSVIPCDAGSYGPGQPSCTLCPAGSYSSVAGSTNCTACPAGTASSTAGADSSAKCIQCPAGYFSLANSSSCTICPTGYYSSSASSSSCTPCPAGTYYQLAAAGAAGPTVCTQQEGEVLTDPVVRMYPPGPLVASSDRTSTLTSATLSGYAYGNGDYTVAYSTSQTNDKPIHLFDGDVGNDGNTIGCGVFGSGYSSGSYTGANLLVSDYKGDWVTISLPSTVYLSHMRLHDNARLFSGSWSISNNPEDLRIYGSNDGGTTWTYLARRGPYFGGGILRRVPMTTSPSYVPQYTDIYCSSAACSNAYSMFGMTINQMSSSNSYIIIGELQIFASAAPPASRYPPGNLTFCLGASCDATSSKTLNSIPYRWNAHRVGGSATYQSSNALDGTSASFFQSDTLFTYGTGDISPSYLAQTTSFEVDSSYKGTYFGVDMGQRILLKRYKFLMSVNNNAANDAPFMPRCVFGKSFIYLL